MNRSWTDQLKQSMERISTYWKALSTKQKGLLIGSFVFIFTALSAFIFFASRPEFVPLYTGQLSQREVGDIKAELDKQGYTDYKLSETGTMLLVPKKDAPDLIVTLASEGYPKDNKINYGIFGENLSFGATDRQYDILEREAMQNQVAQIIKNIDGIKNAEVILTLPEDSVFVKQDEEEAASASVMVEIEPGNKLNSQQIRALYTLVSKSVPNLPLENITIMNQYSETLALEDADNEEGSLDKYAEQRKIQKDIEGDIQKNLQNLLGSILGTDKVFVHTFVKMNFDKVKTQENLVKPADDSNKGVPISSEKSSKTSSGTAASSGGVVGTGETDVPGYSGTDTGGENNYEETQERINYEVNRINNEIIKSPYQIEDITINVGVEADSSKSGSLPMATEENIRNIVSNTVRTALGHPDITQDEIDQRITIFPHTLAKNTATEKEQGNNWIYIAGAGLLGTVLAGGFVWWILRKRKEDHTEPQEESLMIPLVEEEEHEYFAENELSVENQLKKLLDQRPEDFSKVIRTWINEEG